MRYLAYIVFALLILPLNAEVLVTYEDIPPYSYRVDGQDKGLLIDFLNEIGDSTGLQFRYRVLPTSRLVKATGFDKPHLILGIIKLPERELNFHWLVPTYEVIPTLFALKKNQFLGYDLEEIKTLTTGVTRGGASELFAESIGLTNIDFSSKSWQIMRKLRNGRIDIMLSEPRLAEYLANEEQIDLESVEPVKRFEGLNLYFYVAATKDMDPEILDKLLPHLLKEAPKLDDLDRPNPKY